MASHEICLDPQCVTCELNVQDLKELATTISAMQALISLYPNNPYLKNLVTNTSLLLTLSISTKCALVTKNKEFIVSSSERESKASELLKQLQLDALEDMKLHSNVVIKKKKSKSKIFR